MSVIICMESIPATDNAFDIAVLRALETGLGIVSYTLVTLLLWPTRTLEQVEAAVRGLMSTQHQLYMRYMKLLDGEGRDEDTGPLRMQELQQFNQLSQALAGARTDSYEVWEARRQWARFHSSAQQVMETLERWRASFDELQELDLEALMPDLSAFAAEMESRFGQIEAMLGGQAPARLPKSLDLSLNTDAVQSLSHFQKAALALSRTQLRRLEALTRSLFEALADIKGFASARQQSAGLAEPGAGRVPDVDSMLAAVRVMAGLWMAYLGWIYLELPGGVGLVIITVSLGMATAARPQIPISLLVKPFAVSTAFASIVYVFLMPQLSSFVELGSLIFAVTFAICFLFYAPRQALGRVVGLVVFLNIAAISNQQTYSFLHVANTALMLALVLGLLAFAAYVPVSPKPDKAFLRLLQRFFRSCEYLASTLRWDPARAPTRLDLWRRSFHAREVATLPQKLALWARAVDRRLLPGTTADQVQSLAADIQALSYGMQELLEARTANRSAFIAQQLSGEIDTWRARLQEVFGDLALDSATVDHARFRAQLDAKLEGLEQRLEQELDRAEPGSVSTEEAEKSYRLLGAHRRLSEALINLSRQVATIDWPSLREARF